MHGSRDAFAVVDQLFLQLLTGAQSGENDLDVLVGLEARQPDHLARQVDDAHGATHLEEIGPARLAGGGRLQDQLAGLGDGHEVPGDLGIGDRHRPAARDLLPEQRNDAAARAQHVPEAHDHEPARPWGEALEDQLGSALGCSHHAGRSDGLVGRHEDELGDLVPHRRLRGVQGPEDVVPSGFSMFSSASGTCL